MSEARDNKRRKARACQRLQRWKQAQVIERKSQVRYDRACASHEYGLRNVVREWLYYDQGGDPRFATGMDYMTLLEPRLVVTAQNMLMIYGPKGVRPSAEVAIDRFFEWFEEEVVQQSLFKEQFANMRIKTFFLMKVKGIQIDQDSLAQMAAL